MRRAGKSQSPRDGEHGSMIANGGGYMKTGWIYVLTAALLLSACEKARLDQQVKELCAKDGGIKVYETVKLPAEKFDQRGQVNFFKPTQGENALGSDYLFKEDIHYFQKGNPSMLRWHYKIIRRADGKLLGEAISYGRGGGDLPGPWEPSNFHCPPNSEASEGRLLLSIFIAEQRNGK
jgi:hypothetical protein